MTSPAQLIPYAFAKSRGVLVRRVTEQGAELCLREDATAEALAEARRVLGMQSQVSLITTQEFANLLTLIYTQETPSYASNTIASTKATPVLGSQYVMPEDVRSTHQPQDLLESDESAPVVRLMNAILTQALQARASDIHLEPYASKSVVRFRIDGQLRTEVEPHVSLHAALVSRLKVMAQLDIAEKRLPQDGRFSVTIGGRSLDIRLSSLPTGHGERVVLRLLEKNTAHSLSNLGMDAATLQQMQGLVQLPHGIVLVTGPTGSGKTSTLYAAMRGIEAGRRNIMTVEDPIEYDLPDIAQTQVNTRIDMSFARALRAILRQDPDVVMVGEIRDSETARIAVQASLTGHLVLATLHTNHAISAVTRLMDMGVEPFLLASSLSGVLAQRLVRQLCPHCRQAMSAADSAAALQLACPNLPAPADSILYRAVGCAECHHSGYRGRTGIYELLIIDETLRQQIYQQQGEQAMLQHAIHSGMQSLRQNGMRWVLAGITTLEELLAVTRE